MGLIAAPLVGWNFPRQVSSATSENKRINVVPGSAPYETGDANGGYKFKYHPTGDRNVEPRESPAALNAVIVPDLNLPKVSAHRK